MNCFYNTRLIPLPSDCYCRYLSGAFDGNKYYFCIGTDCDGRVDIYDKKLKQINSARTCRAYCAITFDFADCCFWAAACNMPARLYKLDMCLREIDSISLTRPDTYCVSCGSISGVSYNCGNNTLVVSFYDAVWEINKNGDMLDRIVGYKPDYIYTGVLSVYPNTIISLLNVDSQIIIVINKDKIRIEEDIIPLDFQLENIIFNPCVGEAGKYFALVTRYREYSQLLRLRFFPELVPAECNFDICKKSSRPGAVDKELNEPVGAVIASTADGGNKVYAPADSQGNEVAAPISSMSSKCDALLDALIEMEGALTAILNTEGDKLRRAISDKENAAGLAAANKSIDKIVTNIASLEETLCKALTGINELYKLTAPLPS